MRKSRPLSLDVNGKRFRLTVSPDAPLLTVLRNDLGLCAPKYGCGLGQCGACTVLVDGVAARSCVIPVGGIVDREVTTLEGIGRPDAPHPVQQAFIDEQAAQCGYCLNGMIMTTVALLAREPAPDDARIRAELAGNLCRCGTHVEIVQAVQRAARTIGSSPAAASGASAAAAADASAAAVADATPDATAGSGQPVAADQAQPTA